MTDDERQELRRLLLYLRQEKRAELAKIEVHHMTISQRWKLNRLIEKINDIVAEVEERMNE